MSEGPTKEALLDATTPEKLAELMAANPDKPQEDGVSEPAAKPAADAAPTQPAAEGATPGATEQAQGIATKSGAGVLPYHVLANEREGHKQTRAERDRWKGEAETNQQRLAELEQANASVKEISTALAGLTDAELEEADTYASPGLAKLIAVARTQRAAAAQPPAAPAAAPAAPAAEPTAAQQEAADEASAAAYRAMSDKPLLVEALTKHTAGQSLLWNRALELDAEVRAEPAFAGKQPAEVFAEVQTRLAKEIGRDVPSAAKPPPAQAAPAAEAEPFRPNTTTDLLAGATPDGDNGFSEKADGMAMANRFLNMTEAQIASAIRRSV